VRTEQRRCTRYRIDASVIIEAGERSDQHDTGEIVACQAIDLSVTGFQVVLDQSIAIGRAVRVCLDLPKRDPTFVIGRVVWQLKLDNDYHQGLEVLKTKGSDAENWHRVLADFAHSQQASIPTL
jgi:hypothetical protein